MNTRHVTSLVAAGAAIVMLLSGCGSTGTSNSSNASDSNIIWPFAVWCGWVCQVVTVLRSSLPQVR